MSGYKAIYNHEHRLLAATRLNGKTGNWCHNLFAFFVRRKMIR